MRSGPLLRALRKREEFCWPISDDCFLHNSDLEAEWWRDTLSVRIKFRSKDQHHGHLYMTSIPIDNLDVSQNKHSSTAAVYQEQIMERSNADDPHGF